MRRVVVGIVPAAGLVCAVAVSQTADPTEGIKKTALDYVEGWYNGDAARMERALHPDLAKRHLGHDAKSGKGKVEHMSAMKLVQLTRARGDQPTPQDQRTAKVTVLDVYGNTASVRADMHEWIDYMHMVKSKGEWKIVNVLWEPNPETKKKWGMPEEL
jgi:hypothetical protein